jgi:hypothetical protein
MGGAAIAVGHVDQGSLGASQDGANTNLGASVDQAIIWKTEEIFDTFALQYVGNRVDSFHGLLLFSCIADCRLQPAICNLQLF